MVEDEITLQSKPEKIYWVGKEVGLKDIWVLQVEGMLFLKQVKVKF